MNKRWIIGSDGSDGARAAHRWAAAHATRAGATVEPTTAQGDARSVLLDAAADAALLVVGRRGSGSLRRVVGSVAGYCAAHSTVPVVVVPPRWYGAAATRIAVGYDGSANADAALRWALDAALEGVEVELVIAIEPVPWLSEELTWARFPEEIRREEQRLTDAAAKVDPDGRAVRHVVLHGARQALVDAAGESDLVVVGARGRGRIGSALLGSVSSWLLHHAPVPVVVVPDPG